MKSEVGVYKRKIKKERKHAFDQGKNKIQKRKQKDLDREKKESNQDLDHEKSKF